MLQRIRASQRNMAAGALVMRHKAAQLLRPCVAHRRIALSPALPWRHPRGARSNLNARYQRHKWHQMRMLASSVWRRRSIMLATTTRRVALLWLVALSIAQSSGAMCAFA